MNDLQQAVVTASLEIHQRQDRVTAARRLCDFLSLPTPVPDDKVAVTVLWTVVRLFLDRGLYEQAASLLWSQDFFTPEPRATKMVWETIRGSSSYMLMGAASMSKSYSAGVWHFLDWLRDPEWTTVKVVGPSQQHLEENLFSNLVRLHQGASLPMPGQVGELFIGLNPRDRASSISGVIVPIGKKAGKIQGGKQIKRTGRPHPIFGSLSRVRIFLDEAENIPLGIWSDVDNVLSLTGKDAEGFKIGGAFNPRDRAAKTATICEPVGGWDVAFDIDNSERWKSARGWDVCRLDAMKSENVLEKRVIYPGMQTAEGVAKIVQNSGGFNTPGYFSMVRAAYPPQGTNFNVIPNAFLADAVAEFHFIGKPEPVAGFDAALEGGDTAVPAIGRYGLAIGWRDRHGKLHEFRDPKTGALQARFAIQVDNLSELPPADTTSMGEAVKEVATANNVRPWWLCVDRTGNGAGVHDWLKRYWAPEVKGVNFSESPSGRRIMEEDTSTTDQDYDRIVSELWFVMRSYLEFNVLKFSPEIPEATRDKLLKELGGRLYLHGKRRKVESKTEYKSRNNPSPDRADAVSLLVHAVRMQAGLLPSMQGGAGKGASADIEDSSPEGWVGATDRLDDLDTVTEDPLEW